MLSARNRGMRRATSAQVCFNGPERVFTNGQSRNPDAEKNHDRKIFTAGYQTPAMKYGADLVVEIPRDWAEGFVIYLSHQ